MRKSAKIQISGEQVNYGFIPESIKGDDVIISGISGRLPESENMMEFQEHLMRGEDMVTENDRRWEPGLHGLPRRSGKLKDLSRLDASFFGITPKQTNAMDPQLRMLMEVSYEAILDAGIDPQSIRGKKVAVIIGCSDSETMEAYGKDVDALVGYELTGCSKSMFANRLSFFYGVDGPSYSIDQACSSSLLALEHAVQAIRSGHCEAAIVGGCTLNLRPGLAKLFNLLGMTSETGACRSFDADANGFCRGEGLVCIYLQRASEAKRIYATVVNIGNNVDGAKLQGITFPNGEKQQELWEKVYADCGVDPSQVTYVEAHSTGTPVGDPQEGNAIDRVFCKKTRENPLLVGSVKSNMGHAEPAAGIASLTKVLIAMESGVIPPNLHYDSPNPAIHGLCEGRMKVVTKCTKWPGGYMAINSSGFGGTNVHCLLKSNPNARLERQPASEKQRLVIYCGRTEEGLKVPLHMMQKHPHNVELHALLQETALSPLTAHPYRGFAIVNSENNDIAMQRCPARPGPIWFIFPGMGTKWHGMGRDLMELDCFRESITESHNILKSLGIDLLNLLMKADANVFKDVTRTFTCIVAIQVALVDTLKRLGIEPDGMIGHSVGELVCGYADGCLTKSQTVLAAYWRGRSIKKAGVVKGAMAAVGMTWEDAKAKCPEGIVPACHNAAQSVTISGAANIVSSFVASVESDGGYIKAVESNDIPFHSPHLKKAGKTYHSALQKLIKAPRARSAKWMSSSVPELEWDSKLARMCSAEYHTHNFVSPVLFHEAVQHVPEGAVVIEIAPHSILRNVLKKSLAPDCTVVSLMQKDQNNGLHFLLLQLGRLYTAGVDINPIALQKPVPFPVSRGTPMISPLIKWDYSQKWRVPLLEEFYTGGKASGTSCTFELDTSTDGKDHHLVDHVIDGRLVLPVTACLVMAWKGLAKLHANNYEQLPVKFTNINIHAPTILPQTGKVKFVVHVMPADGSFKVSENDILLVSGYISVLDTSLPSLPMTDETITAQQSEITMNQSDIYKDLRLRGYHYGPEFQGIIKATCGGERGQLRWNGLWVPFLDSALQIQGLGLPGRHLLLPQSIKHVHIDPLLHASKIIQMDDGTKVVDVLFDRQMGTSTAGGIQASGMKTSVASRRQENQAAPVVEEYRFVPYHEVVLSETDDTVEYQHECEAYIRTCLSKMLDNHLSGQLKNKKMLKEHIANAQSRNSASIPGTKHSGNDNALVLNLLHELLGLLERPTEESEPSFVLSTLSEKLRGDLPMKDMLLNRIRKPKALKTSLDVLQQFHAASTLKVCEYNASNGHLFADVVPQLESHPGMLIECTAFDLNPQNLDSSMLETHGVKSQVWDFGHDPPSELLDAFMVFAYNFSVSQANIQTSLTELATRMMGGGFILLCEPTKNFTIPLFLSGLLSEFPTITDKRTCGPFCDEPTWQKIIRESGLRLISQKSDGVMHTLFLCRKDSALPSTKESTIIPISSSTYEWVDEVRRAMDQQTGKGDNHRIWLTSEDEPYSGIIGLVNCLKQEPSGQAIRCLFMSTLQHGRPISEVEFEKLVQRDLPMNVFQDEEWGSFMHLPTDKEAASLTVSDHACADLGTKGDVSTLQWVESPLKHSEHNTHKELCQVVYAAVNQRDVLYATGRLLQDDLAEEHAKMDSLLGMEFAGIDQQNRRVMGLVPTKGLATSVSVSQYDLLPVPENWSLEDAATVPYVYASAYLALVIIGRIQRNQKVLIHSGGTPVGQAAIAVSLQHGCKVYTSVLSDTEAAYLKTRFPVLTEQDFIDLGDPKFQWDLLKKSSGQAMDIIFGAKACGKLDQSLQILESNGQLVELGKLQLIDQLVKAMDMQTISCHGVRLDALLGTDSEELRAIYSLIQAGIQDGTVKPLPRDVFSITQLPDAFRSNQDQAKILIKIRPSEAKGELPVSPAVTAQARIICHPHKSYILTGGMGGFGLELADWLVNRGARCLVLASRSGVQNGYQALCLRRWRQAGVTVKVLAKDICSMSDTKELIEEARTLGSVGGIFHLAMVLRDGYIDKQTPERFVEVCDPKVKGILNLDKLSREKCSESLEWFVAFSSLSCGRGNAGQSNYGYGNSVMERVCEQRKRDGLPGVAIQWGAIGDVGVVFEALGGNETIIGGSLPQRLSSCLASMDMLLHQPHPVVSIHVLSKHKIASKSSDGNGQDTIGTVAYILGVDDVSSIDPNLTLGELGIDSLMGLDIRQALERGAGIAVTLQEIRELTFAKLETMMGNRVAANTPAESDDVTIGLPLNGSITEHYDLERLMPARSIVKLNTPVLHPKQGTTLFVVSPVDGTAKILRTLSAKLECAIYGLQCSDDVPLTSVKDMAAFYIKKIREIQKKGPYNIAGYSYGACVAFEMVTQMERDKQQVSCFFMLDGAYKFVSEKSKHHQRQGVTVDNEGTICLFIQQFVPVADYSKMTQELWSKPDLNSQIQHAVDYLMTSGHFSDPQDVFMAIDTYLKRIDIGDEYFPAPETRLAGQVTIIKAADNPHHLLQNKTTQLQKYEGQADERFVPGDHRSFILGCNANNVAKIINDTLDQFAQSSGGSLCFC